MVEKDKYCGQMLINGKFESGGDFAGSVHNPWNNELLGEAARGTEKDLHRALDAANKAFEIWKSSARYERQELLRTIARKFEEEEDLLTELLIEEVGKPIIYARGEVSRLIKTFELAADALFAWGIEAMPNDLEERGKGYRIFEERFPVGPILGITPYNWPYNLAAHKIAPALAVGATIVIKPSPKSLLCTYEMGKLIHEAGCPAGVVNIVDAPNSAFPSILSHPALKGISFTGSAKVGWQLKSMCPPQIPVILELGGNAFAVVMSDADIEWAVQRVLPSAFAYAGQVCISAQHIIVQIDIYNKFKESLLSKFKNIGFGDPHLGSNVCGPMIDEENALRIEKWIYSHEDCTIHQNGTRAGNVIPPAIVECSKHNMELPGLAEEIFGPVVTLSGFETIEEAIEIINSSPFGIQTGVFTQDIKASEKFYRNLNVGGVILNDAPSLRFDWFAYGGEKQSGFGREGIVYSMNEFSTPKCKVERLI